MKSILLLYLKVFALLGTVIAVVHIVLSAIFNYSFDLNSLLYNILIFGGGMSVTLVTIHLIIMKFNDNNILNGSNISVLQEATFISNATKMDVINAMHRDAHFNKMAIKDTNAGFTITSNSSILSWGETMDVKISPLDNDQFEYGVSSKPTMKTTLLDYGKNKLNIEQFKALLHHIN